MFFTPPPITTAQKTRVLVFAVSGPIEAGVVDVPIMFPTKGRIIQVTASCHVPSSTLVSLSVEKTTETDFAANTGWQSITISPILLQGGSKVSDPATPRGDPIMERDYFRLNILDEVAGLEGLSVEVVILV